MADADITANLSDTDIVIIYRPLTSTSKRKAMRTNLGVLKEVLLANAAVGPVGPQGPSGLQGLPGKDGVAGPKGDAGSVGPIGPAGAKGDTGATGAIGSKGDTGATGAKGDTGTTGAVGPQGVQGPAGIPKRIERYSGVVVGSAGIASITFPAFTAAPLGDVIITWDGAQMVTGSVTATTPTTATVKVMKSVATLLLNASPFGVAAAGTPVTIQVIGT